LRDTFRIDRSFSSGGYRAVGIRRSVPGTGRMSIKRPTVNAVLGRMRRMLFKRKLVAELDSAVSGRLGVYDRGWERVLVMNGEVHSVYFPRWGWGEAKRDYWGLMADPAFGAPSGADVLMLGLGGGTTLHLLASGIRPATVTAVERDPEVIRLARSFFDIDRIHGLRIVEGDAHVILKKFEAERRTFDLIIDDVFFSATSALAPPGSDIYGAMLALLRPGGSMVLNRPVDHPDATAIHLAYAEELRSVGNDVIVRSVRGSGLNDLIHCRPVTR
jgi:spermidine synthase